MLSQIDSYELKLLDRSTAVKYVTQLAALADQIPLVTYTSSEILAEQKGNRVFHGKWEHSLVLFDQDKPIAVILGYEREAEQNVQYPTSSIYISELAVDSNYQHKGIAKKLLKAFIEYNSMLGFKHLTGRLCFSVQTNQDVSNIHVQRLYQSIGFTQRAIKAYSDRTDMVMGLQTT